MQISNSPQSVTQSNKKLIQIWNKKMFVMLCTYEKKVDNFNFSKLSIILSLQIKK